MFDMATMWLPGFGPEPDSSVPATVSVPTPLASEIHETLKPARPVWPAMAPALWDRKFSGNDRMQLNIAALQTAAAIPAGQAPTADQAKALNLFNGWGTASALFHPNASKSWVAFHNELESLVGKDGMERLKAAVTTSFFTPPAIAKAMWAALERMGFKGGNILDPSAGHGMFLAQMPKAIAERSQVTAIEPDTATAKVLNALYAPYGVNVMETTFEAAPLPEGFYDAVVTNVPFGDFGVAERRNVPFRKFMVHDYFLARAMEVVRPGGVVAVITSAGTMDKDYGHARRFFASKARLLQAVRLPVDAFEAFAGTSPVTDILVFQRLETGVARNSAQWVDTVDLKPEHPSVSDDVASWLRWNNSYARLNRWFADKPETILGTLERVSTQYGIKPVPKSNGIDLLAALTARLSELPADAYKPRREERRVTVAVDRTLRPGSFSITDTGEICVVEGVGNATVVNGLPTKSIARIRGMVEIRELAKALFQAQSESTDDSALEEPRRALNETYDGFVKTHDAINHSANLRAFSGDPALPMLQALEVLRDDGSYGKADVFSRRTVRATQIVVHCDTAEEALKASMAVRGKVDEAWIEQLTGMEAAVAMDELERSGLIFRDPAAQRWETSSAYLSGNVRKKLHEAEAAGLAANAEALRQVIPDDLLPHEIRAGLGATWVPIQTYTDFCQEVLTVKARAGFDAITGTWSMESSETYQMAQEVKNTFGVPGRLSPIELMEKQMNQQQATVSDPDPKDRSKRIVDQVKTIEAREKQSALNERFVEWLWSDKQRSETLARIYNDRFNCIVNQEFDGSHMALPGFSDCYNLYAHQKDAIWRVITSPRSTLLAHRVGFGKSLEMICAGMELRRVGVAGKIAYVVPNATLGDFVKEFVRAYPSANLLVATEKDFAGDNRRRFLARAASSDWDGVVVTHSAFERIRLSEDDIQAFVEDELATIEAAIAAANSHGTKTVKQLERAKAKWQARLARTANRKGDQDDCLTFNEIGFDWLMVDEAHYFKNLFRFSKMERVAGLPDSDSERAMDMFLKCRHVMQRHDGKRGVVFATGTPVANSMAELFTMQRFLQPEDLEAADVQAFDAWASNFGEIVTALEIAPDGSGYRMNRRFSRFVNIPELMAIFRLVADIKVGNPPCLKLPDFDRETIAAESSKQLKAYVETLVERAEKIRRGGVKPNEDNMLAVTNDGRKAALDMRLIDRRRYRDDPSGKVNLCIGKVLEIWQETASERLTQVVFCDLGTPGSTGHSVYGDIRTKLLAAGVPADEIAFAHDAQTHAARAKLAENVRDGRIRIVLGSTLKLGVGVNIQTRLVALHHLDAPWRPADIEQREGRIVRQKNQNGKVRIFRYVTQGSFDAYMWQTLETKAKFITQVMSGDKAIRTAEDLELAALSYAEVKALASGNPMVIEKAGVDAEVAKLAALRSGHLDAVATAKRAVVEYPTRIEALTRRKAGLEKDKEAIAKMGTPVLKVRGQPVPTTRAMGEVAFNTARSHLFAGSPPAVVGFFGDLQLTVEKRMLKNGYRLKLVGAVTTDITFEGGAIAAGNAIQAMLDPHGYEKEIADATANLEYLKVKLVEYQSETTKPFPQEARFRELLARQEEINAALDTAEDMRQAA